jgi:hypothetical protein
MFPPADDHTMGCLMIEKIAIWFAVCQSIRTDAFAQRFGRPACQNA